MQPDAIIKIFEIPEVFPKLQRLQQYFTLRFYIKTNVI